jgi:hypothetical protein
MSRMRDGVLRSNLDAFPASRPHPWRRPVPAWLVFALIGLTFGLYAFVWIFTSWRQLKQEQGDDTKHPFWHTLAMFVPIYGFFRFYAHMRAIRQLARAAGAHTSLLPALALLLWIAFNVLARLGGRGTLGNWLIVAAACGEGALFAWAQTALNRAWSALPGGAVPRHTRPFEWLVLVFGGLLSLAALLR